MKPVIFKCRRSGNTVSFTNPDDIKGLRAHEGYTEVIENVEVKETPKDADENAHADEKNAHEENGTRLLEIPKVAPILEQPPTKKKRGCPKGGWPKKT